MSTSVTEVRAERVDVTQAHLIVHLLDGRIIHVPWAWFPRLQVASMSDRADCRLIGGGLGIHWPAVDEDIRVDRLLDAP